MIVCYLDELKEGFFPYVQEVRGRGVNVAVLAGIREGAKGSPTPRTSMQVVDSGCRITAAMQCRPARCQLSHLGTYRPVGVGVCHFMLCVCRAPHPPCR
jgi:hypothetical protein